MKRKWELVRQASLNFNNQKAFSYKDFFWYDIPHKTIQITKMYKLSTITWGEFGKKSKRDTKKSKRVAGKFAGNFVV